MVDVHAIERLPRHVSRAELRTKPELEGMALLQKGNRLSVQRVGAAEWNAVLRLAKESPGE
jgi:predicted RNA-binding protein with PUA-like domain